VEIVRMLYGAVYQFEERNSLSGLDLARVYGFFRKGSQPPGERTRNFNSGPSGSAKTTLGPEVIWPIGWMESPRNFQGRLGRVSRLAVKSSS
jgi:hypothetical protein